MASLEDVIQDIKDLHNEAFEEGREQGQDEGRDSIREGGEYGYCPDCDRSDCDDCERGDCQSCDALDEREDQGYANGWNDALIKTATELGLGDYLDKFKMED